MKNQYFTDEQIEVLKNNAQLVFTDEQVLQILLPTPEEHIEENENESGEKYKSVKGSYVKERLNFIFGFGWEFEILSEQTHNNGEVVVKGKLNLPTKKGNYISRSQFGKHQTTTEMIKSGNRTEWKTKNVGNAYKSATTDCLKKCASEFGFFWDIYQQEQPEEFKTEVVKPISYQEKKILERFETALKKCKTKESLEEVIIKLSQNELTEAQESIISDYREKLSK